MRSLDFLKGMTGLKYADFTGNLDGTGWSGYNYLVEVYGDVSSILITRVWRNCIWITANLR